MYEDIFPIPTIIFSHKRRKKKAVFLKESYMSPLVATSMQSSSDIQLNNVVEKKKKKTLINTN